VSRTMIGIARVLAGMAIPCAAAASEPDCLTFAWSKIEAGTFVNERGAIHIPMRVAALGGVVPFQLDTGSGSTLIYDGALPQPTQAESIETQIGIEGGNWTSTKRAVKIRRGMPGKTSKGTLGIDVLTGGFVLDMPNRQFCKLTPNCVARNTSWTPITRSNGSPVVIVNDGERDLKLLLDTGSSAFSIISTRGRSKALADGKEVRVLDVPSFNTSVSVSERVPAGSFRAFGETLDVPLGYAFTHPFAGMMLDRGKIDGLIGLTPFAKGTLVFDFANERMAFVK
jgi:hypothetical protein